MIVGAEHVPPAFNLLSNNNETLISNVYFRFVNKPFPNQTKPNPLYPSPAKLIPNLANSYKMFFQNVTHCLFFSAKLISPANLAIGYFLISLQLKNTLGFSYVLGALCEACYEW